MTDYAKTECFLILIREIFELPIKQKFQPFETRSVKQRLTLSRR